MNPLKDHKNIPNATKLHKYFQMPITEKCLRIFQQKVQIIEVNKRS
jgi:hypothetical protein